MLNSCFHEFSIGDNRTQHQLQQQWNGIMGGWVTQFPLGPFCSHILIKTRPLMVLDAQNTLPSTLFIALINWLWTITNITEHIAADNFPTSRGDTTGHNKMLFNYMFGLLLGWRGEVAFCAFCVMSLPVLLHQVFLAVDQIVKESNRKIIFKKHKTTNITT